ncbi:hypothetical protein HanHA300_Chr04g0126201 [Helianthus annuus]|nr:hypothetical protein HanHA300_Chr04g0126201 [Helianthus annuus]KAJ0596117.1 hypothetical protein HanHA89_Chr04g0139121 [Helianthus annuus]KAJ0756768.1 hypothetical protein HanLR1_Chr04g0130871 [Helianthus annuus]
MNCWAVIRKEKKAGSRAQGKVFRGFLSLQEKKEKYIHRDINGTKKRGTADLIQSSTARQ